MAFDFFFGGIDLAPFLRHKIYVFVTVCFGRDIEMPVLFFFVDTLLFECCIMSHCVVHAIVTIRVSQAMIRSALGHVSCVRIYCSAICRFASAGRIMT